MHSCIGSDSSEGLECDNGEIVSFIHSESIDDRAGTMMEVFVRLVSYKQRDCTACKFNEMEKKNRDRAFAGGVRHFKQVNYFRYFLFLVYTDK